MPNTQVSKRMKGKTSKYKCKQSKGLTQNSFSMHCYKILQSSKDIPSVGGLMVVESVVQHDAPKSPTDVQVRLRCVDCERHGI